MEKIYLDYNATSPMYDEVVDEMLPYFSVRFGNPSSTHYKGREAKLALSRAREKIAKLLGANSPDEIFFTSGGTESDNLAILGLARSKKSSGHIVVSSIEHSAVLDTCKHLEKEGWDISYVKVDHSGAVDPEDVKKAIKKDTVLVSVMQANNETGVIQPVEKIGKICRKLGVVFHVDAIQSAGKIPVDVNKIKADILSVSAHKFGGPKGVGAIYVRTGVDLVSISHGGHQENNIRTGTENVAGIVGMARALEMSCDSMAIEGDRIGRLRNDFEDFVLKNIEGAIINGDMANRLPNTSNISFDVVSGEGILLALDMAGVAVSTGSACTSKNIDPSHVLTAMGIKKEYVFSSVRFSFGRQTTDREIQYVKKALIEAIDRLRK